MSPGLSLTAVGLGGGALSAACLLLRIRGPQRSQWSTVAGSAAAVGAVVACLAGQVAVLAGGWLVAAVAVSARDRPTNTRVAVGVLGDTAAVAGFVLAALNAAPGGASSVNLTSPGATPAPEWAVAMVAVGIALRAAASGMREPGLLVVACTVGARVAGMGAIGVDGSVLVALGLLAGAVAWAEGPLPGLAIVGVSLWGVGDPGAIDASAFALAGSGIAATAVAFTAAPAVGSRWRSWTDLVPPGGVTAGGLTLLAATPMAIAVLQIPIGDVPEVSLVLVSTVAVLGAGAAAAGVRKIRDETFSPRALIAVAGAGALALGLVAPRQVADALDVSAHGLVEALERTRGATLGAGVFAVIGTAGLLAASRLGRRGTADESTG